MGTGPRLTRRQLNRTLLRRQLLAGGPVLPAAEAVARVAGLQAQVPRDPYFGVRARVAGFRHEELAREISGRRLVRVALMRSTIHLVTAADCRGFRPAVQQALDRDLFRNPAFAPHVEGLDLAGVIAAARDALREQPMTASELGERLRRRWPGRDARSLAYAVRNLEPLVQVPPRGLWGMPGQPRLAAAADWIGDGPDGEPAGGAATRKALESMAERYLAAFGPARVADIQAWAGLTRLAEVVAAMRGRLRAHAGEDGRELWDVPDGEIAPEDATAPVRFLPEFDNAVLGYADRSRILPDGITFAGYSARLRSRSVARGGVLAGGFLRGTWSVQAAGEKLELHLDPFDGQALGAEAEQAGDDLLAFVARP